MNLQSKLSKKGKALKTLSWPDVLKGLKEGRKFRRQIWRENEYIKSRGGAICDEFDTVGFLFLMEDFEAPDWIECQ